MRTGVSVHTWTVNGAALPCVAHLPVRRRVERRRRARRQPSSRRVAGCPAARHGLVVLSSSDGLSAQRPGCALGPSTLAGQCSFVFYRGGAGPRYDYRTQLPAGDGEHELMFGGARASACDARDLVCGRVMGDDGTQSELRVSMKLGARIVRACYRLPDGEHLTVSPDMNHTVLICVARMDSHESLTSTTVHNPSSESP